MKKNKMPRRPTDRRGTYRQSGAMLLVIHMCGSVGGGPAEAVLVTLIATVASLMCISDVVALVTQVLRGAARMRTAWFQLRSPHPISRSHRPGSRTRD